MKKQIFFIFLLLLIIIILFIFYTGKNKQGFTFEGLNYLDTAYKFKIFLSDTGESIEITDIDSLKLLKDTISSIRFSSIESIETIGSPPPGVKYGMTVWYKNNKIFRFSYDNYNKIIYTDLRYYKLDETYSRIEKFLNSILEKN